MKTFLTLIFLFYSNFAFALANDGLLGKKILCSKLLWGFEFFSSDKVNVISTDINDKTEIKEFHYEIDYELPFVNLYSFQNNIKEIAFSIHHKTLRVDIWTMTSGGITTREIIPAGFCEEVKINNLKDYIKELK